MTSLKGWFLTATVLSFLAGGGAILVFERIVDSTSETPPPGDADGYVEMFDREIGITSDAQRQALRSYYDQYWRDLRALTTRVATQHRDELSRIDREFRERVTQALDPDQRRRWAELTGRAGGESGPPDPDASEQQPPDAGRGEEK